MMKIRVTRSPERDVAEWVDDGLPDDGTQGPGLVPGAGPKDDSSLTLIVAIVVLAGVLGGVAYFVKKQPGPVVPLEPTVADLAAVHPGVSVRTADDADGESVRKVRRLSVGSVVETDANGRARLRLDRGTDVVIDRDTRLHITDLGIELDHGRIFVRAAVGAQTEIDVGEAVGIANGVTTGIERPRGQAATATLYAANAELTVRAGSSETKVSTGETAHVHGTEVEVKPERSFDDWTGGMAAPWAASGPPRRAVGEMWGRAVGAPAGNPGSPLTIRSHEVRAEITGEVAQTTVRSTFFNAGSENVVGDFRMAVPPGAIVSRFATRRGDYTQEGAVAMSSRTETSVTPGGDVLEWAGEGWLRGTLSALAPGATTTVVVQYVEWLTPEPRADGETVVVQYRYPMVGDSEPPLVGEFFASVDASPSSPVSIGAGLGAKVKGSTVELRRPDFRPVADLVVDVEMPAWSKPARMYVVDPEGEDPSGRTVVLRTEAPKAPEGHGVTLALVMDTSASVEPALLDAERSLVEAVVGGLGPDDRVLVLAADQLTRPIGPPDVGPATSERREAILSALANVEPGGATDLGRALEAAADRLPSDAPEALVVYVGDGWPTVGDRTVEHVRARLARREGGAPRLGAVAIGPVANKYALASLVRGSGPLFEMADSSDAPRVGVDLLSSALLPTLAAVELDLGPRVERVYPNGPRAVAAEETITVVGRVRGDLPKSATLRYRQGPELKSESRPIEVVEAPDEADVRRRWASGRVEEIVLSGKGREAAVDVALSAGLVTPWTAWVVGGGREYVGTPLSTRVLDLAARSDAAFAPMLGTPASLAGTLAGIPDAPRVGANGGESMDAALVRSATRSLDGAMGAVRACRDSRAALRPELAGNITVQLKVSGSGEASDVRVRGDSSADDAALNRCVAVVVEGLVFVDVGVDVTVDVSYTITLPKPEPTLRGRKCSATSTLGLPLRRGVWRERLARGGAPAVYLEAKRSCELRTWSARRALLELILEQHQSGPARLSVARTLHAAAQDDAARFIRREAIRRARSPEELQQVRAILLGDESYPEKDFEERYQKARDDEARLALVRSFLGLAPHDPRLRRRLLALLESTEQHDQLREEVRRLRLDPFADAGLLGRGASALHRIGDDDEARRTFGELAERAPSDPWARAYMGDRLLEEGWHDDATDAYFALEALVPGSPAVGLRLANAHARAGRIDIAHRMLLRVAQTGGRMADPTLSELGRLSARVLLAETLQRNDLDDGARERLRRAALEVPGPTAATVILVRAPASSLPIDAELHRGAQETREVRPAELSSSALGLYGLRIDPGDESDIELWLKRPKGLAPSPTMSVEVRTLTPSSKEGLPVITTTEVELPLSGDPVKLEYDGGAWRPTSNAATPP